MNEYPRREELLKQNAQLKKLLNFAIRNLRFEIPEPDPESEYDYCCVCQQPDWNHAKDCAAIQWKQDAKDALR